MTAGRIGQHELNRQLEVWSRTAEDDGQGGTIGGWAMEGAVWAKVSQPTAAERTAAAQAGSLHTHVVHMLPNADVRRGDQLRGQGQTFDVRDVITPSEPVYLRADVDLVQPERPPVVIESS